MAVIRFILCVFFVLLAGGCGQTVHETLHVPADSPTRVACPKTIVVLPFADYFYSDNVRTDLVRNSIVMEYLADRLVAKGVKVPIQDDVLKYLADRKLVSLLPPEATGGEDPSGIRSLVSELQEEWSDSMKEEIRRYVAEQEGRWPGMEKDADSLLEAPGVFALEKKDVQEIGRHFHADYLVRGRIIEYYLQKGKTDGILNTPPQAVVHLRVWVQSTATGEVVWTNRAEVKVSLSPQSDLVENKPALFETALSRAATTLMDDFWQKINS